MVHTVHRRNMSQPSRMLLVLRSVVRNYTWVHIGIGILGNLAFFVGSLLFLSQSTKPIGTGFFIAGSLGMLVGSLGRAIVDYEDDDKHLDIEPGLQRSK